MLIPKSFQHRLFRPAQGAREFQRFLLAKQREITAVVEE
ncbi:DUF4226 domain-containing protein, partial [Mycobacterium malmoense]